MLDVFEISVSVFSSHTISYHTTREGGKITESFLQAFAAYLESITRNKYAHLTISASFLSIRWL